MLNNCSGTHTTWRVKSGMLFGFSKGVATDELHCFSKSSETRLPLTTNFTALLNNIYYVSNIIHLIETHFSFLSMSFGLDAAYTSVFTHVIAKRILPERCLSKACRCGS